jgi:hypothetical protein
MEQWAESGGQSSHSMLLTLDSAECYLSLVLHSIIFGNVGSQVPGLI